MRLFKQSLASAALIAVGFCLAQPEVRITRLYSDGMMEYTLEPADGVSQYACTLEWCADLRDAWTNDWYKPFETTFAQVNGAYSAAVPRFFRIHCQTNGTAPASNATNYVVVAVVPSVTANGVVSWTCVGSNEPVYHVEFSTNSTGNWSGQWPHRTNLTATSMTTNAFRLPMFFRVVTIKPDEGVDNPW